jgi:transmembrane 9 superfamily protein 2/4
MLQDTYCKVLCQVKLDKKSSDVFKKSISHQYHNNWIVDNLPGASILDSDHFITTEYTGFPVGFKEGKDAYIYNHVNIILEYSRVDEDAFRIVGFYIEPLSIKHRFTGGRVWDGTGEAPPLATCDTFEHTEYMLEREAQKADSDTVLFTYDVEWRESSVLWASRWDVYLTNNNAVSDKVHWFSIVNSIVIVLFLSFMVGMILVRALNKDISRYNRVATDEDKADAAEEFGWKLVHADVFRPPSNYPMLYCIVCGTGTQLYGCLLFMIIFAAVGFLSPANRGSLMIAMLMIFVLMGSVAGYTSARLYKTFKGKEWQRCTLLTATLFPGICFFVFFVLDIVVWSYGSTGAVPFLTMLAVLALWFGISVPLVFLGAYVGYRKETLTFPVVTSNIPRPIPEQPWYMEPTLTTFLGGILPFGACFVEMFFIMSSVWMDQYYYVFGFLLLSFIILTVTCAEVTIVLCYFQLCAEDYRWWWRAVITSGSTAIYVFLYSCIYFARLESNMVVTYFLYFVYMAIISLGVFLVTASVGFFSALYFTHYIYSSIKVD